MKFYEVSLYSFDGYEHGPKYFQNKENAEEGAKALYESLSEYDRDGYDIDNYKDLIQVIPTED